MAYGLHNMYQDVCGRDAVGLCPDLFPFNGSLFKVWYIVYRRYINKSLNYYQAKGSESLRPLSIEPSVW
jgi:hypothetical protein